MAEVDENGCLETTVTVKRATSTDAPVKRPARKGPPILPGVFDRFGGWPSDPAKHGLACAEYQYLRSAAGFCRQCPNRLGRWKHRCDECQEKERIRFTAAKYAPGVKRPKSKDKINRRKLSWAARVRRSYRGLARRLKRAPKTPTLVGTDSNIDKECE